MIASRRKFLFWLGKAPAIVAASSIMPIVMRRELVVPDHGLALRGGYEPIAKFDAAVTSMLFLGIDQDGWARYTLSVDMANPLTSNDPSVDLIPINRNDGFIRHRVVARG